MTKEDPRRDTLLTFPCDYIVKVIGKTSDTFEGEVIALVRKIFPKLGEGAVKLNQSKENTYIALTISLKVDSKQQLDLLYKDLSDSPHVIFAL
jgi:uncharacterized protein